MSAGVELVRGVERGLLLCGLVLGGQADCCCGAIKTEGRNCSQTGAPCVMPPPPPAPPAPPVRPAHAINAKRGFVGDGGNCNDAVALNVSGWYYGYNVVNPYRSAKAQGDCALANSSAHLDQRFAPMNWCLSSLTTPVREPRRAPKPLRQHGPPS